MALGSEPGTQRASARFPIRSGAFIRRVFQNPPDHTPISLRAPGPCAFFGTLQATTDFTNPEPVLSDSGKDLPHHAGFFLYNLIASTTSLSRVEFCGAFQ